MPRGMPIVRSVGRFAFSHAAIVGNGTAFQNVAGSCDAASSGPADPCGASNCVACAVNAVQASAGYASPTASTQPKRWLPSESGISDETASASARDASAESRTRMSAS